LNVRGAFSVSNPSAVLLKHVLLIDDILTTGATARAAAQALIEAGAASVWVATLARARRVNQFGSRASFQDEEPVTELTGNAPPAILHGESKFSSQDQPSF
jgi:adenine/guanine phosphoribosyltransferase-like PRPP-binding protein